MNHEQVLLFEECKVGMKKVFEVSVEESMMVKFREISGDENSLHIDAEYAKKQGFDDKVVYGFLTASFLSRMVGMYLPGKYCIIQEVSLKFPNPVYLGEKLTVEAEIKEKYESVRQLELKVRISKENTKTAIRGTMKVGVLESNNSDKK